ncbi:MAG: hypothetical protein HY898_31230 [Deltaproteobacteria bacterium]|nr:hypothetical protein [Deltaproteobacteria bacterium]
MRSVHCFCALGVVAAGLLYSASASAQLVDVSGGVKGFAGGNVWSTPSAVPFGYEGNGFSGNGGGFGWGAGLYTEARFIKFLGLELGLTYDSSTLLRNVTINAQGVRYETQEKVTQNALRIPILAKGILPIPFGRLSAFLGPEFIVPSSASGSLEVKSTTPPVPKPDLSGNIKVEKTGSTMLTMGLGLTIDLPASFELPIELRASKNLSQPDAWADRVSWAAETQNTRTAPYTVKAQNSWDFRLGLGLGYKF